jgi:hypothetical protein
MFLAALILALTLAALSGGLYFYVLFLEARVRQQRRRISELERAHDAAIEELRRAPGRDETRAGGTSEVWPEVIDEGGDLSLN